MSKANDQSGAGNFQLIPWQEKLVQRMLSLSSFTRYWLRESRSNGWIARKGRNKVRGAARAMLLARGYDEQSAAQIVRDAEDHARLLFNAESFHDGESNEQG